MGEVVQLPLPTPRLKLCSGCEHGYMGASGVFCILFNELIWLETAAEDCDHYEEN